MRDKYELEWKMIRLLTWNSEVMYTNTRSFEKRSSGGERTKRGVGLEEWERREKGGERRAEAKEPVGCEAKKRTGRAGAARIAQSAKAGGARVSEQLPKTTVNQGWSLAIKTWVRRRARGTARTAAWRRRRGQCRRRGMRSSASAHAGPSDHQSLVTCNHYYWALNTEHRATEQSDMRRDAPQLERISHLQKPPSPYLRVSFRIRSHFTWSAIDSRIYWLTRMPTIS